MALVLLDSQKKDFMGWILEKFYRTENRATLDWIWKTMSFVCLKAELAELLLLFFSFFVSCLRCILDLFNWISVEFNMSRDGWSAIVKLKLFNEIEMFLLFRFLKKNTGMCVSGIRHIKLNFHPLKNKFSVTWM